MTKSTPVIECKFVTYTQDKEGAHDLHVVKEVVHHPDGSTTPQIRLIKDFQRTFWITKPAHRNHKVKKEGESLEKVNAFKSTQCKLTQSVRAALGMPWSKDHLRELCSSPYIYGTDVDSTTLVKAAYRKKFGEKISPYTVSVFDVETDVLHGTGQIVMATQSMKDKVVTRIQESFVKGYANPVERIKELADKYIGDILKARNITLDIQIVPDEISVVKQTIEVAHTWKPDFFVGWNVLFDIEKVLEACKRVGVDPADIFNDPAIPKEYKLFKVKEGVAKRISAGGVLHSFKPAQRWHTFYNPASFYILDAMGVYYYARQGEQDEPSYALDAILTKHLKRGKLKFTEADAYSKLAWHQFMQRNYPLEYVVYNLFDCIGIEMLDEKTQDLAISVNMFSGVSDFRKFNSQPKRKAEDLHFVYQEHGHVFASTGPDMSEEGDKEVVSVDGHVITLPSERIVDNGLQCILEDPTARTNIRIGLSDLDVAASYPNNQSCLNIAKDTTVKEIIRIQGIDEQTKRYSGYNLSAGHTNAVDFCTIILGCPELRELGDAYLAMKK